jgi:hypothetical protein
LCFIEKATFVGGFFVCFGLGALRAWGAAASSCWSTRNRQPPHPMHATLWVFAAKTFARNQTSEATSDADFGEGLRAGDDFWYSSMRNLP